MPNNFYTKHYLGICLWAIQVYRIDRKCHYCDYSWKCWDRILFCCTICIMCKLNTWNASSNLCHFIDISIWILFTFTINAHAANVVFMRCLYPFTPSTSPLYLTHSHSPPLSATAVQLSVHEKCFTWIDITEIYYVVQICVNFRNQ